MESLTVSELYRVMAARESVFVVEQACAYPELDGLDLAADHLVGWAGSEVAAYLRVLPPGVRFSEHSIGRVLTARPYRRQGWGRALMREGLRNMGLAYPGKPIRISAQAHLESFYRGFGFQTVSAIYLEDGIPHLEMLLAHANLG